MIGDEPGNTVEIRKRSNKLCRKAKVLRATVSSRDTSLNWPSAVCLAMKPVGEPDAGNPHVRFDERGEETGCRQTAQATAPLLDSTLAAVPGRSLECPLLPEADISSEPRKQLHMFK